MIGDAADDESPPVRGSLVADRRRPLERRGVGCRPSGCTDPRVPARALPPRGSGLPPDVQAAIAGIDAERIRAHVKFLADDLLEGRGTGTRGGDIAARYIASQFELYGLQPAGDDGGYLQRVDFQGVQTLPATSVSLVPAQGAPIDLQARRRLRRQ